MRLNDCDPQFKHEIAVTGGGAGVTACFACAGCSARCPVGGQRSDYDPRRIIRLVLMGACKKVLSSPLIWLCSSCYTCQEVCPQGVRFPEVLTAIKKLATAAGHAPPRLKATVRLLAGHGRLLEVGEFENEKRAELGLPPVSECPADYQAILGETGELAEAAGPGEKG
jgi:heterodisulfide reductase subunit C